MACFDGLDTVICDRVIIITERAGIFEIFDGTFDGTIAVVGGHVGGPEKREREVRRIAQGGVIYQEKTLGWQTDEVVLVI